MRVWIPFVLFFGCTCGLSYLKEIDRLERDEERTRSGKRMLIITLCALGMSFLFTLWSADAGLILLTLTFYLFPILAGIASGQSLAWTVYRRRNPGEEEEE